MGNFSQTKLKWKQHFGTKGYVEGANWESKKKQPSQSSWDHFRSLQVASFPSRCTAIVHFAKWSAFDSLFLVFPPGKRLLECSDRKTVTRCTGTEPWKTITLTQLTRYRGIAQKKTYTELLRGNNCKTIRKQKVIWAKGGKLAAIDSTPQWRDRSSRENGTVLDWSGGKKMLTKAEIILPVRRPPTSRMKLSGWAPKKKWLVIQRLSPSDGRRRP